MEQQQKKKQPSNHNTGISGETPGYIPASDPIVDKDEFIFDYEEITNDEFTKLKEPRSLPTNTRAEVDELDSNLTADAFKQLSTEAQTTTALADKSRDYISPEDIGTRPLTKDLTNDPKNGDVTLGLKELSISKRVSSPKAALMKLSKESGVGGTVHIPLWHSGFWVTMNPMSDEDIVNFELELVSELKRVGRITNTLIFSNYSVVFTDVIIKHFLSKLTNSSIKLTEDDDILELINVNDTNIIALSMAKSMYPNGFQAVMPCSNAIKLDSNGVPKCGFKAKLHVDLEKLEWLDHSKLEQSHIDHMTKKRPNSVTIDEVKKYQNTLPYSGKRNITLTSVDGNNVNVVLKTPSIGKYLESGLLFIEDLREKTNEIIKNNKQITDPEDAERILINAIYLQLYNHYVDEIPVEDTSIKELADINEALAMFSSSVEISEQFNKSIKDYINDSLIVTIGIPNFKCPDCGGTHEDVNIIALSVYEYFFTLLHSKYTKILRKIEKN